MNISKLISYLEQKPNARISDIFEEFNLLCKLTLSPMAVPFKDKKNEHYIFEANDLTKWVEKQHRCPIDADAQKEINDYEYDIESIFKTAIVFCYIANFYPEKMDNDAMENLTSLSESINAYITNDNTPFTEASVKIKASTTLRTQLSMHVSILDALLRQLRAKQNIAVADLINSLLVHTQIKIGDDYSMIDVIIAEDQFLTLELTEGHFTHQWTDEIVKYFKFNSHMVKRSILDKYDTHLDKDFESKLKKYIDLKLRIMELNHDSKILLNLEEYRDIQKQFDKLMDPKINPNLSNHIDHVIKLSQQNLAEYYTRLIRNEMNIKLDNLKLKMANKNKNATEIEKLKIEQDFEKKILKLNTAFMTISPQHDTAQRIKACNIKIEELRLKIKENENKLSDVEKCQLIIDNLNAQENMAHNQVMNNFLGKEINHQQKDLELAKISLDIAKKIVDAISLHPEYLAIHRNIYEKAVNDSLIAKQNIEKITEDIQANEEIIAYETLHHNYEETSRQLWSNEISEDEFLYQLIDLKKKINDRLNNLAKLGFNKLNIKKMYEDSLIIINKRIHNTKESLNYTIVRDWARKNIYDQLVIGNDKTLKSNQFGTLDKLNLCFESVKDTYEFLKSEECAQFVDAICNEIYIELQEGAKNIGIEAKYLDNIKQAMEAIRIGENQLSKLIQNLFNESHSAKSNLVIKYIESIRMSIEGLKKSYRVCIENLNNIEKLNYAQCPPLLIDRLKEQVQKKINTIYVLNLKTLTQVEGQAIDVADIRSKLLKLWLGITLASISMAVICVLTLGVNLPVLGTLLALNTIFTGVLLKIRPTIDISPLNYAIKKNFVEELNAHIKEPQCSKHSYEMHKQNHMLTFNKLANSYRNLPLKKMDV